MEFEKAAACKVQTAASVSYVVFSKCPLHKDTFNIDVSFLLCPPGMGDN